MAGAPAHLTALGDDRSVLLAADEVTHDVAAVLAAPVGEPPGALGDRHIGRVRLTVEVVERRDGLKNAGVVASEAAG